MNEFHFPSWVNRFVVALIIGVVTVGSYLATCLFAAIHPTNVNVGHAPIQPVPYSHKLHAGKLKIDCRYCHNTVEQTAAAMIPPISTCGNCHGGNRVKEGATLGIIFPESDKLKPIRDSLESADFGKKPGDPVLWVKVHDLPDFVYFNHSAHVNRGVSCVTCHGRIDKMEVVTQVEPLSMKWCLDCHRNPAPNIRPPDLVTTLDWNPSSAELKQIYDETLSAQFGDLDPDGDGAVPLDVAGAFVSQPVSLDSDHNGLLSRAEISSGITSVDRAALGRLLLTVSGIHPRTSCSTCHR